MLNFFVSITETTEQFILQYLGDHEAPRKLTEHNHVLLSVVKHTQTVIRRSKSTAETPPIEMLNMNAERMDIHDAMDKYKVFS
ncbi:unnamed protein product [Brugia pahangi]|uniref:Uncharacterized protein n=1 Tax=Brugia pahangi TaxID=6280 RepID=A0A0N4TGY9_BRUPA|nr:unnamed protein product [Brugia pahangi]